jgi:hypothetical protein
MNPEAERIIGLMKQLAPDDFVDRNDHARVHVYQTRYLAQLMTIVAEEQEKSAAKVQRQTTWLIFLTWALVALTAALLVFTMCLYQDARTHAKRQEVPAPGEMNAP